MGMVPSAGNSGCNRCVENRYTPDGSDCLPCPSAQQPTALGNTCACKSGFYNSSSSLYICFADGYDRDQYDKSMQEHVESFATTGQECDACPIDASRSECLICEGEVPVVAPGFIIPQLDGMASSSRRRSLQLATGVVSSEITTVFRCHMDLELAVVRCPSNPDPAKVGQCAQGYSGYLCDSCDDGFGMTSKKMCESCQDTGFTGETVVVLVGMLAAIALFFFFFSRFWSSFRLKHLARCMFQP